VLAGALFTSLEIWLSGNAQLQIIIPPMLLVHALIGIGEALITVAALSFLFQSRPDLLDENSESAKGGVGWMVAGGSIALVVVLLSPLASADPDGLERVAGDLGFLRLSGSNLYKILPDYTLPFLGATPLSTILAGVIGVIVVGIVIYLLGQGLKAKA
jgi:cobalt/nickel transport system permease protein